MIVVCDTSPLNYLILVEAVDVLPRIFQTVYAPSEVIRELTDSRSPGTVRLWANSVPLWLTIRDPVSVVTDPALDPGETTAIALAEEICADAILIDEKDGRRVAQQRGLQVIGTMGVLARAAQLEFLGLPETIHKLRSTNFHVKEELIQGLLRQDRDRIDKGTATD